MKFLKISFIFLSLIFLSGCLQTTALLGPSMTIATTGNVLQAGLQYGANTAIKNETGKDTFEYIYKTLSKIKVKLISLKENFQILWKKNLNLQEKN